MKSALIGAPLAALISNPTAAAALTALTAADVDKKFALPDDKWQACCTRDDCVNQWDGSKRVPDWQD